MQDIKTIRLNLTDVHLERIDEAGRILGHTSRSETMRWLALNAVNFAEGELTGFGIIEKSHHQELEEGKTKSKA